MGLWSHRPGERQRGPDSDRPTYPPTRHVWARSTTRPTPRPCRASPEGYRFHDLRHYYASALIASGLDIKTVQIRMRHASGKTMIDTYGHMFPDADDATRETGQRGRIAVGLGAFGTVDPSGSQVSDQTS